MAETYTAKILNIPNLTGDDAEQVPIFIEQIENAKIVLDIKDNKMLASVAVMKFAPNSTVFHWHKVEIKKGNLKNLDIWLPTPLIAANGDDPEVAAKPGGLKAALESSFVARKDLRAMTKLLSNLQQKPGEKIQAFAISIEAKVYKYEENIYGEEFTTNNDMAVAYKTIHDSTVFAYLYNGMKASYRKYCDTQKCDTAENLLKNAMDFENSEEGMKEIGISKIQPHISGMTKETSSSPSPSLKSQPKQEPCSYCGIYFHQWDDCKRRERDWAAGLTRNRHPNYPCKTLNQLKNEKKKKKNVKDASKVSGMSSTISAGNSPAIASLTYQDYQRLYGSFQQQQQQYQQYQQVSQLPVSAPSTYEYFFPQAEK